MDLKQFPTIKTEFNCFEWQGYKNNAGYGLIYFNKTQVLVHRFIYQALNPEVDISDLVVLHDCDNPSCINPEHLSIGTQQDNINDCAHRGRWGKPRYTKLTKEQAIEIKYSLLPARYYKDKYKVSKSLIGAIRNNIIWKDV